MFQRLLIIFLFSFALFGCDEPGVESGYQDDNIPADTIVGIYSAGFESSTFRPCGSDELWWTYGTPLFNDTYNALSTFQSYSPVYVQAYGDVSALGTYGHLGLYNREFTVTELFEMRELRDGDCNNTDSVFYGDLNVYLDSYLYFNLMPGTFPPSGGNFIAAINMKSLQGIIPDINITNVNLFIIQDDVILWTAMPDQVITEVPLDNALSIVFRGNPANSISGPVDVVIEFVFNGQNISIKQEGVPIDAVF